MLFTSVADPLINWQEESVFRSFNLYRGDLSVLRQSGVYTQDPQTVPLAASNCNVKDAFLTDSFVPPAGQIAFYLVTGKDRGQESSLGTDSAGFERPNDNPCP